MLVVSGFSFFSFFVSLLGCVCVGFFFSPLFVSLSVRVSLFSTCVFTSRFGLFLFLHTHTLSLFLSLSLLYSTVLSV
jgi:hypothetical protein